MVTAEIALIDPTGTFKNYESQVFEHLCHFTNLHWQPHEIDISQTETSASTVVKEQPTITVPFLKVHLLEGGSVKHKQHQILGLHPPPLVQIFVVSTVSIDVYRKTIRPMGKEWLNKQVNVRDPTGYVVVHVVDGEEKSKNVKSIWSRLTNEFDPECCIQLDPRDKFSWKELHMHVQKQLLSAFDSRVDMLESEISKLQATKNMPGWNFGTLFVINESLASAYESLNLIDSALKVYTMLEELIRSVPKKDWSLKPQSLKTGLNSTRDSLVEPMLTRKLSYFDFQKHIVACQVRLFFALASGKHQIEEKTVDSITDKYVLEAVRTAITHIPNLMANLTKLTDKPTANVWLLRATKELYDLTAEYGSSKLAYGKGDILLIQRDALQNIAMCYGWKIPGMFNDISLEDNDESTESLHSLSEWAKFPELQDETAFRSEFVKLTETALNYFRVANMRRTVTRLSGQLALIEYNAKNYEAAWNIFQKSPLALQSEKATQENSITILGMAMDCALHLKLESNVIECAWRIIALDTKVPLALYKKALGHVQEFGAVTSLNHDLSKWFIPKFQPYINGDEKGYFFEITLYPKHKGYPFVAFNNATMSGICQSVFAPEQTIVFETYDIVQDADNEKPILLRLYTKTFSEGTISFNGFTLQSGNQLFSYQFDEQPILAALTPLNSAFNASMRLSKKYSMRKRNIELQIQSPREVKGVNVHVQATEPTVELLYDQTTSSTLENFTSTSVSIPVLVDYASPRATFRVFIEYDDEYTYESYETVDFSLLVSVDFQEYYREPPKIFLQFLVRPFQLAPITFCNAELTSSVNYEVTTISGLSQNKTEYVGYSQAPVSYVFSLKKITHENQQEHSDEPTPMILKLTYRSMSWEIRHLIFTELLKALRELNLECYARNIARVAEGLSNIADMQAYVMNGKVTIDSTQAAQEVVAHEFQLMNPNHVETISSKVTTLLEGEIDKNTLPSTVFTDLNSEITLEVPDPDANVVHYVKLYPVEKVSHCIVGEVLPMVLEIDTIYIQKDADENTEYEYTFDRLSDGWSYTGKVTGTFKGATKVKEYIDLIPHRSGELHLPNVVIRPRYTHLVSGSGDSTSSVIETPGDSESIVVASHANTQILVVPEVNMLAIAF